MPALGTLRNTRISFLSTILELYSEIAVSRKLFGIVHTYIYTFLLRMTDTVTSQNIDLSSWDTLYINGCFAPHSSIDAVKGYGLDGMYNDHFIL
jgi:hypothetical protein